VNVGDRISSLPITLGKGGAANLADYRGQWLVLYFYPKDNTPGCTTEGIDFNALYPKFRKLKAEVLGLSRDSAKSHQNFCAKHGFAFDLISDADESVCRAFGVIKEKNMYGFLIDPEGRVVESWRGVKVPGHAEAVLDALKKATQAK
jgi:peroxiredoxin Q/BCP